MIKRKPLPSQEFLNSLFAYDPATGILTWKPRGEVFAAEYGWSEKLLSDWNAEYSGKALTTLVGAGYIAVSIFGEGYCAHRVIWKMVHGVDPDHIDHIDGIRTNNALDNLRDVNAIDNQRNRKASKRSKHGVTGVTWCKTTNAWLARINFDGRTRALGRFKTFDEAVAVRKAAEKTHGYHPNHGRAA